MARVRERIMAIIVAMLFLLSSLGATGFIIWQMFQDSKTPKNNSAVNTSSNTKKLEGTNMQNFTPVDKVDALQVVDLTPGTGPEVKAGDTITFDYTGALAKDGTIFQSSLDSGRPVKFALSDLIQGWQQGIPGMKVGGTRRLLIPAALGYGSQSQPGIPANSDLVFDITVHAVGQ